MVINIQILLMCLFLMSSCTFSFKDNSVSFLKNIKIYENI